MVISRTFTLSPAYGRIGRSRSSAVVRNGATVAALCYNLPEPPSADERNVEYASKLRSLAQRVGLPSNHVASIQ